MADFFVDAHCKEAGILTSYVEALDAAHAERVMKEVMTRAHYTVTKTVAFPIDEIPCDCAYFNSKGQSMPPLADQVWKWKKFQRLDFEGCPKCGSTLLFLKDENSCNGVCAYCGKKLVSPGSENLERFSVVKE